MLGVYELVFLSLPKCGCNGVEGVAGTLDALRLKLVLRLIAGSSLWFESTSSKISFSVRPLYLNLVPHEKKPPPLTVGASELVGKLVENTKYLH